MKFTHLYSDLYIGVRYAKAGHNISLSQHVRNIEFLL